MTPTNAANRSTADDTDGRGLELRAVAERIGEPLLILDAGGVIRYANPAVGWLTGRDPRILEGTSVASLVHPDQRRRVRRELGALLEGNPATEDVEFQVQANDGTWRTLRVTGSNLLDLAAPDGILIQATDVTERLEYERALRDLAYRHPITGVASRRALEQHLEEYLASEQTVAVAFLDLDHFKRINDCLGHTAGDNVLAAVTARIAPLVPRSGLLAHFASDVFAVVFLGLDAARALGLAWHLVTRVADPLYVGGHEVHLRATAGVALRDEASTVESMLRDADAALTRAKTVRRGGVELFTPAMRAEAVDRFVLENEFRSALQRGDLEVHLQPIMRLATGELVGHEALARWSRPDGLHVPAEQFIRIAEECGVIAEVGDWVLGRVIGLLQNRASERISVNLSPRELLDPSLPGRVERLLTFAGLSGTQLSFEITETAVVDNFELAAASLHALRRLGCAVGLDDFGTGYSSLGYLRKLPVDFVKLDRTLIADVDTDRQASLVASSVFTLAHALSLVTVAEGIERPSQLRKITDMGCTYGQGWLFGRPAAPTPVTPPDPVSGS
jgi:diguanylate cyclase (GGDEF)-like protein/PAS domain S-box-containing protein